MPIEKADVLSIEMPRHSDVSQALQVGGECASFEEALMVIANIGG